ncbi:MAG: dihydrodipicolinate reductase [Actinomycetota bacterium]|nr:dihydrodipicolinate reductase [Actinomycetota bacterium]
MTYRVIQWATGAQGTEALRAILDRPDLELAGVKVYSESKHGRDAGELAGRPRTGVVATMDTETVLAIDADCVAYFPRNTSLDEVCRILASGKNVVTTAFLFHPRRLPEAHLSQLLRACKQGGTSVHGTGLNPGNLSGVLAFALSGMSRTIDKITLQERADWSFYESTGITFDNMRFGHPIDQVSESASEFLRFNSAIFQEEVWLIGDTLGAGLDEVTTGVEVIPAQHDHEIFGITLAAGTAAAQRWNWVGRRDGVALVEIETLWTVGGEYPGHWPSPLHGWTLTIEGDPSLRAHVLTMASFERRVPIAEHVRAASVATAMQALNAIPAVCAAAPGIASMADLPLIRSGVGFGNAPPAA